MDDPLSPAEARSVILFDGVCNLCNTTVQWVIKHDPEGVFQFGTLQSAAARTMVDEAPGSAGIDELPDSIILVDADGVHTRSSAALRIARRLGFPYTLLGGFWIIPRPVRDAVYAFVARNRYRWFGKQPVCMVPTPELKGRFIDAAETPPQMPAQ